MCKDYVEYNNFDELPEKLKEKFKSRAKGLKLDESKNGYVDFINQLKQRSDNLVGGYFGNKVKTQVKFGECGHTSNISPSHYKKGQDCAVCDGKQVQQGVNDLPTTHPHLVKEWHPTKNELTPHDVTQGSSKKVWWKCEQGHEWEVAICNRSCGYGCPYCSNKKVLKGYNDLATTHPQYVKYFVDVEDAYMHTYSSNKKVKLKCSDCGYAKIMSIDSLTRYGFSCNLCSDGISYPEKLVSSVLNKLEIEFIKQISYDGDKHRYDFYLPKYKTILETHGDQHYRQGFKKLGKTLEEEQENDRIKRELANKNGILNENYHEINCRYSTLEWCRPNIEQALGNYVDMSVLINEDWQEIDRQSQKSLKVEICKYWDEHKENDNELTTKQIANVFGLNRATIIRYLNWGGANGVCTYNAQEETVNNDRRRSILVHLVKPNGDRWYEEGMSVKELSKNTGISRGAIRDNLDKGALKYHKNSKYDPKYIGSRIVSAEVYDSQIQVS